MSEAFVGAEVSIKTTIDPKIFAIHNLSLADINFVKGTKMDLKILNLLGSLRKNPKKIHP